MICEMCGKDVPSTKPVFIERSKLNVCPNCAKFGDEYRGSQKSGSAPAPSASVIEQRLERREKRMRTRDIYEGTESTQLIGDYGDVIREARMAKGMDLEQFAASISEKKGTLAKIESYDLVPDDKIRKKLEKALGVKLTEAVVSGGSIGGGQSSKMTLSNFIRKE